MPEKDLLVTLTIAELEQIIEKAMTKSLNNAPPPKLMFSLKEAAAQLGVEESWLAEKVRQEEVPHRRPGHRIYFSPDDLKQIVDSAKVEKKRVKVKRSEVPR